MKKDILKNEIRNILIKEDPMGIYFPDEKNIDEYDKEIDAIIELLEKFNNEKELLELIWQLFKLRFGNFEAGPKYKYESVSKSIWSLVKEKKLN